MSIRSDAAYHLTMSRRHAPSGSRAVVIATALLALTLGILQPVVHAVMMRDADGAGRAFAAAYCLPTSTDDRSGESSPPAKAAPDCCLAMLAGSPLLSPPDVQPVAPRRSVETYLHLIAQAPGAAAGIRDGPGQPRAPPVLS